MGSDPYRTSAAPQGDLLDDDITLDVGLLNVTVHTATQGVHGFPLEGSGPPRGVWLNRNTHDTRHEALRSYLNTASSKLQALLKSTHDNGFMFVPNSSVIIPEHEILRITYVTHPHLLTWTPRFAP